MQIIVTRTKTFMQSGGGEIATIAPSNRLTEVPNWIADTQTFKLGIQDKSIQVLRVVPTRDEVIAAGYSPEAADAIIEKEQTEPPAYTPPELPETVSRKKK